MKSISKAAAEFLRKAVGALRGKAGVLRARLLFLASLRRRTAVVAAISRHIRVLAPRRQGQEEKSVRQQCRGVALATPEHADDDDDDDRAVVGSFFPELARLLQKVADEEGDGGYPDDWTLTLHSLFDEEDVHRAGDMDAAVDAGLDDDGEPSVIDVIRSRREADGKEFRIEDEIDQAADMFITRVRRRRIISAQQPELDCR